ASVIVFLLVAGIVGTTTGLVRAVTERNQKDTALQQVRKERDQKDEALQQKDENWRKARRALETTTDGGGEELLGRQVQLTDRTGEFLKKVLAGHADLAAAKGDDPEGRQSRAEGYFLVGMIRHKLGETKEAEAAYRDAVAIQKELADDFPS